jgi:hypothetical protein
VIKKTVTETCREIESDGEKDEVMAQEWKKEEKERMMKNQGYRRSCREKYEAHGGRESDKKIEKRCGRKREKESNRGK